MAYFMVLTGRKLEMGMVCLQKARNGCDLFHDLNWQETRSVRGIFHGLNLEEN